jgi:hypothetical protein
MGDPEMRSQTLALSPFSYAWRTDEYNPHRKHPAVDQDEGLQSESRKPLH